MNDSLLAVHPRYKQTQPLRYPGGKSRMVKDILQFIPADITELCSPFFGGGSVELACASRGVIVFGYDCFAPIVALWNALIKQPKALADGAEKYLDRLIDKANFKKLQDEFSEITDQLEIAIIFFILNRSSFGGTTLSGGFSPGHARFTAASIDRLRRFRADNLKVSQADFRESLNKHDCFFYLDPPYITVTGLYGTRGDCHKNFPHEELAEILKYKKRWILSYNNHEIIRRMYAGYRFVNIKQQNRLNHKSKQADEVLIFSNDLQIQKIPQQSELNI